MKYGEQFESESVPQWSLYNIDYNSLKHHIKVHTTKDQASAILIPGQPDTALTRFEDELYSELCRQHDRVDLFVKSKADELGRRMQHLSNQIHKQILRLVTSRQESMSLRRQRRFAKYEDQLLRCGEEIQDLDRFVNAQIVAFRKILKKYKKWTGSSALGTRFRDTILSDPKSFTRRDTSHLHTYYEDLLETLRATSSADGSTIATPRGAPEPDHSVLPADQLSPSETIVVPQPARVAGYWNEYEYGSEAGDAEQNGDGCYAIYIDPNEDTSFPGFSTLKLLFKKPVSKWKVWTGSSQASEVTDSERSALLPQHSNTYGSNDASYFGAIPGEPWRPSDSDADEEDNDRSSPHDRPGSHGYASSTEGFPTGYRGHYAALPSIPDQRIAQYRDRVLFWGTWAGYVGSFILMGIAMILITTGRQKKRLEVDVGVTLGIMASLCSAVAALCMAISRHGRSRWIYNLAVWVTFAVTCVLNGILLVLLVANTPL
ncbi:xenotropic and polytropic retrovirus receptor 1 [Rhypophila decipiens]